MTRQIQILIGLMLTLVVPILASQHIIPEGIKFTVAGAPLGQEFFWWVLVVVVVLYILLIERRSLQSIGLRMPSRRTFVFGIAAGVLLVGGIIFIYAVIFPLLHLKANAAAGQKILATPFWYRVLLVTRAAVAEEVLFRGYPIERIGEWPGSRWLGAVIAWAAFTYAHLGYWGWAQLLIAGWGGLILTLLYLWRRDLVSNMVAHFVADGAGFLLR